MVSQLRASRSSLSNCPSRHQPHPWLHAIEGTVQVFTSPYRSFFTHVMVQAMRVAGQGNAVLIAQFLKGGICQGIEHPMQFGQGLEWIRPNIQRCLKAADATTEEQAAIAHVWTYIETGVMQGRYSLVVLDELSLALQYGLLSEGAILNFLRERPSQVDVILTGPDMPKSLLAIADQVTEVRRHLMP